MRPSGNHGFLHLRRWRRAVVATLLPALLLSMSTGSSCLAMTLGDAAIPPAPTAHVGHMHHAAPAATTPAPGQPLCPHCQTADQLSATSHTACGAGETFASGSAGAQHGSVDAKAWPATAWVPLPSTPAPPLIHAAAPPFFGATATSVPLHIRHCVLLI
jgi:hypothetical protein